MGKRKTGEQAPASESGKEPPGRTKGKLKDVAFAELPFGSNEAIAKKIRELAKAKGYRWDVTADMVAQWLA